MAGRTAEVAEELRQRGNAHFREQQLPEAISCYRETLALVAREVDASARAEHRALVSTVCLNLAACLLPSDASDQTPGVAERLLEVEQLCGDVLSCEPQNVKALFRRGAARFRRSRLLQPGPDLAAEERKLLHDARQDALEAARVEPNNRQARSLLDDITQALREPPPLYSDCQPAPTPPLVVICSTCNLPGHSTCNLTGKDWWLAQRAQWLGVPLDQVGSVPNDFEDDGTLQDVVLEARRGVDVWRQAQLTDEDLSDEERETLEECLEATIKPYPQLKRKLPLSVAVQCAVELWDDD